MSSVSEQECSTQANPLPQWVCHKVVQAVKITSIHRFEPTEADDLVSAEDLQRWLDKSGGARLDHDEACPAVFVSYAYLLKHSPVVGGYFVRYEDGYESFSPAAAFEGGYTRVAQSEQL